MLRSIFAFALALAAPFAQAQQVGSAFTYQGELRAAGQPANAAYDFQFRLLNSAGGATQVGPTVTAAGVSVINGLFSVPLDFGPAQFAGDAQWLEISVRPATGGAFETLVPRTAVTPTPYALGAVAALANSVTGTSIVDGSVQAGDLATAAVGTAQVNPAQVQRRVTGTCAASQGMQSIAQDGTVVCGTFGSGTITGVTAGTGLTGGGTSGSVTLGIANGGVGTAQINADQVQRRVTGQCALGQYVRAVTSDGTVTCGTDATGTAGWALTGNAGTNPATNFIGTTDAQAFVVRTRNAQSLRIEPSSELFGGVPITTNTMAGSSANTVTLGVRGATISGGGVPTAADDPDFAGENPNRVTDHFGSVGGGYANRAGDDAGTTSDRAFATVGGGQANIASGSFSTVGGGANNTAGNLGSTVDGGFNNTASGGSSTVGGGFLNIASGERSTVGGGDSNTASGPNSTVGGGVLNVASGSGASTVGGGGGNFASGSQSTVSGGSSNTASGQDSTVSGGLQNCAGGLRSWAGGTAAKVRPGSNSGSPGAACNGLPSVGTNGDQGTFVWADSSGDSFVSTGSNQFLVRATGGIYLGADSNPDIPSGRFINTSTGAHLTTGGTWTNASSRALKTAFEAIDPGEVLSRLLSLPLTRWQYRDSPAEGLHLGPVAEEFHAAFGLGADGSAISTVDASGVALAAIQGLNAKLEAERDTLHERVEKLDAENAALRARLEAIEARLGGGQ
jgi:hypothetical protein